MTDILDRLREAIVLFDSPFLRRVESELIRSRNKLKQIEYIVEGESHSSRAIAKIKKELRDET